ncbi:MAG: nuclear transport factor 2 family protein [Pyrinomonadaceae bacterium]|nr:nuclear transport factor 2 family protein [Pyrinomonadaceae bacterium]
MSDSAAAAHPNLALLKRLGDHFPHDLTGAGELIADDFVFHYFNTNLPELAGDYIGVDGLQGFFQKLGAKSKGTFRAKNKNLVHVGDELVVTSATPEMTLEGKSFEWDALFIWRVVGGRFVEAWDIPAVNTIRRFEPG